MSLNAAKGKTADGEVFRHTAPRADGNGKIIDPDARKSETRNLWGWIGLGALFLLALVLLVIRSDAVPMQLWDESRNANNALEALNGHWLAPAYNGVADHWNTKPPLLIWCIAALLKLGMPPLWALRSPSIIAAFATLGLVWGVLRYALRDPAAATIAGALLLTSWLYVGPHGARTGDYDSLESLFILGYVLTFWTAISERPRPNWLFGTAAFIIAAVLTKGVAGALAVPGLLVFAMVRSRALLVLLKDWRTWAAAAITVVACAGYYLTRETYDPGYISAVLGQRVDRPFRRRQRRARRKPAILRRRAGQVVRAWDHPAPVGDPAGAGRRRTPSEPGPDHWHMRRGPARGAIPREDQADLVRHADHSAVQHGGRDRRRGRVGLGAGFNVRLFTARHRSHSPSFSSAPAGSLYIWTRLYLVDRMSRLTVSSGTGAS